MRFRRLRAVRLKRPRGLRGSLPRDFARQMQRLRYRASRPARGGDGGVQRPGKTGEQLARARRCQGRPRAPGLRGQGRTRLLRATCSARAVRAEARAQSPPGGGARLRAATSPPPQLPGAPATRGRERAAPGSAVGWTGRSWRKVPAGARGLFAGRRLSALRSRAIRRLFVMACDGGGVCRTEKVTGLRSVRGGAAFWNPGRGRLARRGPTDTELTRGRAREAGAEIGRCRRRA